MFQEKNFQTNPKIIVIFLNKLKNEAYSKYNQGAYNSNKSKACKRNAQGDRLVSVFGVVSAFLFTFNFSFQKNDVIFEYFCFPRPYEKSIFDTPVNKTVIWLFQSISSFIFVELRGILE